MVFGTITTLAIAPTNRNTIYIGTDDGNVWVTHNDGATWDDVSNNFPGLPQKDFYVTGVEPSHFDT